MMIGGIAWFVFIVRIDCVPIFSIDSSISTQEKQKVQTFIAQYKNNQDPAILITRLHKNFLWLQDVSITYLPPLFMHIVMHAHKPVSIVNQNFMLLPTRRIVDASIFSLQKQDTLPSMLVHDSIIANGVCSQSFIQQSELFDTIVHQSFIVDLRDKQAVYLRDRVDTFCSLLCSWYQSIDYQIIASYKKIKKMITVSIIEHKIFDIRFGGQIVMYKNDKGGMYVA
jgi:hypothetical protein